MEGHACRALVPEVITCQLLKHGRTCWQTFIDGGNNLPRVGTACIALGFGTYVLQEHQVGSTA